MKFMVCWAWASTTRRTKSSTRIRAWPIDALAEMLGHAVARVFCLEIEKYETYQLTEMCYMLRIAKAFL